MAYKSTVKETEKSIRHMNPHAVIEFCWVSVDGTTHYQREIDGLENDLADEVREFPSVDGPSLFCIYC